MEVAAPGEISGDVSRLKKWTSYLCMALFFLAGGIEYSVVFPTLLDYLGDEEWLYGLTLAGFSISNLVTAPIYGVIFDKTHQTKMIVLFANLFEIGGNFMYFAAQNKYMIMGSRFVVGIGAGAGATLFADLARTTKKELRTTVFSIFMGMRQIGLVIGPAFNLFLAKCNFKIGPFSVTSLTVPGIFMVIIWIIIELLFVFLFFSLPSIPDVPVPSQADPSSADNTPEIQKKSEGDVALSRSTKNVFKSASVSQSDERTPLLTSNSPAVSETPVKILDSKDSEEDVGWLLRTYRGIRWRVLELLTEELVVLLAVLFNTMFNQTAIETMFVPLAHNLLHWKEEQISIFFSVAGMEIIICFVLVSILSKFVSDRYQIVFGLGVELLAYVALVALVGPATSETPWILGRLIICCFLALFGLPFFLVTSAALYSKMLPLKIQGFGQGIRRSLFSVAAILGPLWAGGSVNISYYVLMGVPLGLLLLVLVLILLSFTRLKEKKTK